MSAISVPRVRPLVSRSDVREEVESPAGALFTDEPLFPLSVECYHHLIGAGLLTEDDPVELVEGMLIQKMPKYSPHSTSNGKVRREIEPRLPHGWTFRGQEPLTLVWGEPEPDGAVVVGDIEDYEEAHPGPGDVAIVIEVADSSLRRDRGIKLRSYARAGVPVYWIINLIDRCVEVYTEPRSAGEPPAYDRRRVVVEGEALDLDINGETCGRIEVASLLPRA